MLQGLRLISAGENLFIKILKMKYYGLITVRTSSSRLKEKCLLPFGEFDTLLEHIIARCRYYDLEPIISTSIDASDNIIKEIAIRNNVKITRGDLKNKISRWVKTVIQHEILFFHTVDADDPFFDGHRMKKSIDFLISQKADLISPSSISSSGIGSEGYSIKSEWLKSSKFINDPNLDTEMINDFVFDEDTSTLTFDNDLLWDNSDFNPRLTLDYIEDYVMMNSIANILGNFANSTEIHLFFKKNPDWYLINHFRNLEWKKIQNSKSKSKLHDI